MELRLTGERLVTVQRDVTMLEHLHRYAFALEYVKGKTVLDIASGEGYGTNLLAKSAKQVTGVDISDEAVGHAKKKYVADNLTFIQGSAAAIPLPDSSVDIITSFETIEHHDKHDEMISEFKRVLKKDGIVIISSPDKHNYSDVPQYSNPFHVKELYEDEFNALMGRYFKEIQIVYQQYVTASFISAHQSDKMVEYSGTYENIVTGLDLKNVYNIAIASDEVLEPVKGSFFNSSALPDYYQLLIDKYTKSTTWKVGRFVMAPFVLIKDIFKKK
jgi:ubiquinone/menaquinone biosynthesis C-methylase UbiE